MHKLHKKRIYTKLNKFCSQIAKRQIKQIMPCYYRIQQYRIYKHLKYKIQIKMKTACAFHQGHLISHFCKCSSCLLPLCNQCVSIHHQEHSSISQSIQIVPIELSVQQIHNTIVTQFKSIDSITMETLNRYRQSDYQHKRLIQQIIMNKDTLMKSMQAVYDNIFLQLENNNKRRQQWLRQFNQGVLDLREELSSLIGTLKGEKYLRTVIMWNRMKPQTVIQEIVKKSQKKWVVPTFTGCTQQNFVKFISNNSVLKVLQIQGDSGIRKILHSIRVLRYGQSQSTASTQKSLSSNPPHFNSQQSQISSTQIPVFHNNNTANMSISKQSNEKHTKQNIIPLRSPSNHQITVDANNPVQNVQPQFYFSSPNRKTSSKKLQVLSSCIQNVKSIHQNNQNI